jgi:transcriptional regulator
VVFQGPAAYITPSWYQTKRETGKVVPTYNYIVVHAHGPLRIVEDSDWLRGLVGRLTNRFEAARAEPWRITDAPDDFLEKQLRAIVGLEIPVTRLVGKWKVSQNRPPEDREGVVKGLREAGDAEAIAMAKAVEGGTKS